MRIGLVSPYSWSVPGGVNDHVANLAAQLEARGHEVFIMAPTGGAGHARSRHVSHERFISVGIATPFKSNGSKAYCNPSPFMLLRMKRLLRKMNFDVVYSLRIGERGAAEALGATHGGHIPCRPG